MGIFLYLFKTAVIPLTASGKWRGIADILAVGFYLSGAITLFGISFFRNWSTGVAILLIVVHIAMIFGMLSPNVLATVAVG
ncbi:DUF6803 family protein [Carboxydocella thermautotrophica]|uniref:DUF6803 family protein n=1 Tax=Carboxydocella thermautotrophica TaxID=178899 RepID=UPI0032B7A89E